MSQTTSLTTAINTGTLTTEHQTSVDSRLGCSLVAQGAIQKVPSHLLCCPSWRRMDPPPPKKRRLQGSSSKPEPMDVDPPQSSVEPMEVDIPLEEEPMEVDPPPSRQGRHPNIVSAWRRCYLHRRRTRGSPFPSWR